ncbi:MAG: citryl-CoA lyase [Betaproteobacteria bacterium]|nr:MAG: citryl-CoA lyase [Betaproteobacteria bacterium]
MAHKTPGFTPLTVEACDTRQDGVFVRGYPQTQICGNMTYTESFFLTLRGRLPSDAETKVLDAVLTGMIGYTYWSVARTLISANPQQPFLAFMGAFMAGGDYTMFPQHCGEEIRRWEALMRAGNLSIAETAVRVVAEYNAAKQRMPGVGHPLFIKTDPRSVRLREVAAKHGFVGEKTLLYEAVHAEYIKHPKRADLCINIDGRFACTLLELGFEPPEMTFVAMLSLGPGVIADIMEQLRQKPSLQLMVGLPYEYTGEPDRPLPDAFIRERD